ncbi:glycosyltransferase EpsF [Faecalimonas umbilicata]|uniref:Glycosyltransferase EpsF n=1 Tax=Faecalimonas umbilicata TaxID=1912855 RepID=A0A4R3JRG4_9FIRM|nr:glycosyltransferase [Faecalimonas umbilicata]TCS69655.1 glycosyltransferase EpsF [Faecalimonas umbilicata]GBU05929.1 putative glycosyltransferase EpsF [Faecalimonas umbilicata]
MAVTVWEMNGVMNSGGTESLIMEFCRNKPNDINLILIIHSETTNFSGIHDKEIHSLGIKTYFLPSVGSVGIKKYVGEFKGLCDRIGKPDIVHSHINGIGGIISYAAYLCGIDTRIIHCHADIKFRGSFWYIAKEEILLYVMKLFVKRYGTEFWACSKAAGERLFGKNKKYKIIKNVIDVKKYRSSVQKHIEEKEKLGFSEDTIVVGAVGRISSIKNYEVIIEAINKIKSRNVEFCCYGRVNDQEYYKKLIIMAKELNVSDRVHFLGNSSSICDRIAAFDLFVMPSISEGLGIAALEAQAAGIPSLISTGVPEETDMGIGLVERVDPHNAEQWANAMLNFRLDTIPYSTILDAFQNKGFDSKEQCSVVFQLYRDYVGGHDDEAKR